MDTPPIRVAGLNGGYQLRRPPKAPLGDQGLPLKKGFAEGLPPEGGVSALPLLNPDGVPHSAAAFAMVSNQIVRLQLESAALRKVLIDYLHVPEQVIMSALAEVNQEYDRHVRELSQQMAARQAPPITGRPAPGDPRHAPGG